MLTAYADYRTLLSHYPDSMFMASKRSVDILFAGHTHGGQVVIPGFGPGDSRELLIQPGLQRCGLSPQRPKIVAAAASAFPLLHDRLL